MEIAPVLWSAAQRHPHCNANGLLLPVKPQLHCGRPYVSDDTLCVSMDACTASFLTKKPTRSGGYLPELPLTH